MFPWEKKVENGWRFPEHHVRQPETLLHVSAQTELEGHTTASCQKDTGMQLLPRHSGNEEQHWSASHLSVFSSMFNYQCFKHNALVAQI